MLYITRKEQFCAAHKLYRKDWTEEKNKESFGPCSNPNWHGHNYTLYVTIKGSPDPETGFVMNLKVLGKILHDCIISKVDHKNLNLDVEFMKGVMPTTENLTAAIWGEIAPHLSKYKCFLHCVKLEETEKNYAEYFGGG